MPARLSPCHRAGRATRNNRRKEGRSDVLDRLWHSWLAYLDARRGYHRDGAREIAVNNLRTLCRVTPLTFLLLAVFLLATPAILPGWRLPSGTWPLSLPVYCSLS